jgi:rhamnulokinase
MANKTVLAVDIGAESGRVLRVGFDGKCVKADELYRFPNVPVETNRTLHWDILRLWKDVQTGIAKSDQPAAIGIDTWAIDFGLLDRAGKLIGNPVHYRDKRTEGIMEYVFDAVSRKTVFEQTGIQMLPFNTLYQLVSMAQNNDPALNIAQTFLTIPDLLYYWMTGVKVNEFTNATTTQCYNVVTGTWANDLLEKLGIPTHIFGPVAQPGQILGSYHNVPVVLSAHHDTGSAIVGVPAQSENFAYLSSGTWSLIGLELPAPIVNDVALAANVTNEGGYGGTTRLLKNVMGLWLLQESRRTWEVGRNSYSYDTLVSLAQESTPFVSLINPDDPAFLAPGDMPARIREYCARTGQPVPESIGAVVRCIFESLALKYHYVLRELTALTGKQVDVLHIVGGGSQNRLLCQMTADTTACTVMAGPVEATALGNAVVQLIALGDLGSLSDARTVVRESFLLEVYTPIQSEQWESVYSRFSQLMERV